MFGLTSFSSLLRVNTLRHAVTGGGGFLLEIPYAVMEVLNERGICKPIRIVVTCCVILF